MPRTAPSPVKKRKEEGAPPQSAMKVPVCSQSMLGALLQTAPSPDKKRKEEGAPPPEAEPSALIEAVEDEYYV